LIDIDSNSTLFIDRYTSTAAQLLPSGSFNDCDGDYEINIAFIS
jgi:hypothetical protein